MLQFYTNKINGAPLLTFWEKETVDNISFKRKLDTFKFRLNKREIWGKTNQTEYVAIIHYNFKIEIKLK